MLRSGGRPQKIPMNGVDVPKPPRGVDVGIGEALPARRRCSWLRASVSKRISARAAKGPKRELSRIAL